MHHRHLLLQMWAMWLHWRAACEIHAGMPPRILLDVLAVNSNDLDLRA